MVLFPFAMVFVLCGVAVSGRRYCNVVFHPVQLISSFRRDRKQRTKSREILSREAPSRISR